ncbi:putative bifunctional diguanylate cyclase/phosphodiesterase [Devosia sp.]|uniref:putative bifunctional diguanylate cyclase/phosphodiesterase n=1 Tax=Devosia sp. TaxID=1871048 RepID=UPI002FC6008E
MTYTSQLQGAKSLATGAADSHAADRLGPRRPARAWRNSLLGKTTSIFLIGVVFAYALGALIGWQMFTSAALEQWRNQARMNIQIASATLRNIYTYIAVDVDGTGQVNRIMTDKPIGDDESVLYTGFNPGDVLALIAAQTKNDAWIFRYDPSTGAFEQIAATVTGAAPEAVMLPSDAPLFATDGTAGRFATGFTTIEGERYYVGLLPIVQPDGAVLGAVVASIGREAELNRTQDELVRNSLIALVLVLVLTSIAGTVVANRLFKPVPALIRATLRIANEQTDIPTPFQNRSDEIGDLAVAIETLRGAVVERGHLRDIRDMAVELAHMAHHDPLTGLPNRALLMKTLEDAVAGLAAHQRFNVLMLDLDRFKSINDTLGHASGDNLLVSTANRLVAVVGPGDVVARLGGDEFAIIQRVSRNSLLEARKLAARLLETVSSGTVLDGLELVVGTSIGVACAPMHGTEAAQLLKKADLALYRSKATGRGVFSFFQDGMDMDVQDQHALELDLRLALQREEFELHYQPIVNLATMTTCGFEALVRWRHPQRGLVSPDQFIPLAEETGMIVPLGEWILGCACRDAANWPQRYTLAVNLSPVQIQKAGLVGAVERALKEAGLPATRLELEVTETVVLAGADSIATLGALRARGIAIVLDDFGTGYASLSNLVSLPFSKIKVDRSFVANLQSQQNCRAIVAAITGLARGLDIDVTAEGVETAEQFTILKAAGCTNVQGFYFARPLPLSEIDMGNPIAAQAHGDKQGRGYGSS